MRRPSEVTGFPGERVLARSDFCVVTYECDPGVNFVMPEGVFGRYPQQLGLPAVAQLLMERYDAIRPHLVDALSGYGLHLPQQLEIRIQQLSDQTGGAVVATSSTPLIFLDPHIAFTSIATSCTDHGEQLNAQLFDEEVEALLAHEGTHVGVGQRPAAVKAAIDLAEYVDGVTEVDDPSLGLTRGYAGDQLQRLYYERVALSRQTFGRDVLSEGLPEGVSFTAMHSRRTAKGGSQPYHRRPKNILTYDIGWEFVAHVSAANPLAVVAALELPLGDRRKLPMASEWKGGDMGAEAWLNRVGWLPEDYVPILDRPRAPVQSVDSMLRAGPGRVAAAATQNFSRPKRGAPLGGANPQTRTGTSRNLTSG